MILKHTPPLYAPKRPLRFLHFFCKVIPGVNNGQLNRRVCLMASLIQACICKGHCRQESLSESSDAYRALKKSSLSQQAKRWLSNRWTYWQTFYLQWLFVVRTSSDRLLDFDGEVARFDSLQTTRSICFLQGALPLANSVYWKSKKNTQSPFFC